MAKFDVFLRIRVPDEFKAELESEAEDLGLNLSAYVRMILNKRPKNESTKTTQKEA